MRKHLPSFSSAAPWIAFLCTLLTYWLTVEPGASFWDCPEYIEGALRLEIGHPPGNPTWLLFHRVTSLFGFSEAGAVTAINMAAGFFTAWAVGLLCACSQRALSLVWPGRRRRGLLAVCSLLGALCFGWADSPWFSAVEAEVYAMSLWMTALCVWLALKWLDTRESGGRWQLLSLICYILGLSVGVHQLTMLVIPGIAMIICYGLVGRRRARGCQWVAAILGAVTVAVLLFGLMKGVPRLLARMELFSVNSLGFGYNSGTLAGWILIVGLIGLAAFLLSRLRRPLVSGILWCLFFVCVGFSSYALIIVRANAHPPMNQGDPSDIFSFITYIDRDQYGGAPLLYGSTPYSRPLKREHISVTPEGDTVRKYYGHVRIAERPYYSRAIPGARIGNAAGMIPTDELALDDSLGRSGRDAYLLTGYRMKLMMIPELEMWLPRLHSSNPNDVSAYADWAGMTEETMERVPITEAADSLGRPVPMLGPDGKPLESTGLRPTYAQNLAMLFGYQSGYMYFRYLLWNFGGRQNDIHSAGEVENGNFITGFTPIDNLMLGAEDELPDEAGAENPGRNRYWMVPFIFGIAGLVCLCLRGRTGLRVAGVSAVLFLMTGLAIVLYLNQTPGEPRERDYSFLGSFWVFGFWIAAGMSEAAIRLLKRFRRSKYPQRSSAAVLGLLSLVPLWMLIENYDDHDRSRRYPADDYAVEILNPLPEGTILFTTGDNHTFPLWYARNARGVRRDVAVVNTNYMRLPWQILQLMRSDETGRRIAMTMRPEDVAYGAFNLVRVGRDATLTDAVEALRRLYADTAAVPTLISTRLLIGGTNPVVFDVCERYGLQPGGYMDLKQLAMLDIVATNAVSAAPRPVAWHHVLASRGYEGWKPFTVPLTFVALWEPLNAQEVGTDEYGFRRSSTASQRASRNAVLSIEPVGRPGGRYIDPVYGGMISYQRMSLMTDARRALEAGDTLTACRLLETITRRYPFSEWRPILKGYCGETIEESLLYADLAEAAGLTGTLPDSLRRVSAEAHSQWCRYREALPPRLRNAMTPSSRRMAE
ncbi:MAG: DUF2723 domain-containing protein [Bacteroidales bacterium]|nr:DUF2723 domain-containing protein [Bacteroidales bacterium]